MPGSKPLVATNRRWTHHFNWNESIQIYSRIMVASIFLATIVAFLLRDTFTLPRFPAFTSTIASMSYTFRISTKHLKDKNCSKQSRTLKQKRTSERVRVCVCFGIDTITWLFGALMQDSGYLFLGKPRINLDEGIRQGWRSNMCWVDILFNLIHRHWILSNTQRRTK